MVALGMMDHIEAESGAGQACGFVDHSHPRHY